MNVISAVKPHACHQCGKSFGRRYNLRRHAEHVHNEEKSKMDEVDDDSEIKAIQSDNSDVDNSEPDFKKRRFEDSEIKTCETESTQDEDEDFEEDDSESDTEVEYDESSEGMSLVLNWKTMPLFETGWKRLKRLLKGCGVKKYEKYVNGGMSEDQAKEKANRKTLWAVKRIFFNKSFFCQVTYI